MIRRCELTETAAKLSLQLEAYPIPADFDASGETWEVIVRVRDQYTNYRKLAAALPPCHEGCPLHSNVGDPVPGNCLTYEFAHHMLRSEAKQLALRVYNTWRDRRKARASAELTAGMARVN